MRSRGGFSIVECLIAGALALASLACVWVFLFGCLRSFAGLSAAEQTHTEFLVLREYLARDTQQALTVVERISLDGAGYQTTLGPTAETLVLQLPAVSAGGQAIAGVYDFAVYGTQEAQGGVASLTRRLFTNRDANGNPVIPAERSVRVEESKILVRKLLRPQPDAAQVVAPLFTPTQSIVRLAREVVLTVTLQATESTYARRTYPQTYTARFRLRNG